MIHRLPSVLRRAMRSTILPLLVGAIGLLSSITPASDPGAAIWVWGYAPTYYSFVAPPDSLLGKTVSLSTRPGHTLALDTEGKLVEWVEYIWGIQANPVPDALQGHVRGFAAGSYFSVAVSDQGRVFAWGDTTFGRIAIPDSIQGHVVSVAAGWSQGLAVLDDKRLVLWGRESLVGMDLIPAGVQGHVIGVSAGENIHAILLDGGKVAAICQNSNCTPPSQAQGSAVAVAAGGDHALVLTSDGNVYAWGEQSDATMVPDSIQGKVVAIAAGDGLSAALTRDHRLVTWGSNYYQQLSVPDSIQGRVTAIAAGGDRILAAATRVPQVLRDYEPLRLSYGTGEWPINSYQVTSMMPVVATSSDTDVVAMSIRNKTPLATIKKVGTALISLYQGGSRYWEPITLVETLTVAPKKLIVVADTLVKPVGAADPDFTFRDTGLVSGDKLTGSLARLAGENPGEYVVTLGTLAAGPNYDLVFTPGVLQVGTTSLAAHPKQTIRSKVPGSRVVRSFVLRTGAESRGSPEIGPVSKTGAADQLSMEFLLPGPGILEISIFDHLGTPVLSWERTYSVMDLRSLATTQDGRAMVDVGWNLRAAGGAQAASGVYLWRIHAVLDDGQVLDTTRVFGIR